MEIQTLFYNLREEVSCPVCSDLFRDPRQLPCLHSFCLHCLQHWHQASGGQHAFRCPKCQALSRVPASGDLTDLPASFYLNGLIDVLAIKECSKTQVTCGNCDKKSPEASYCFQCCIFYCERCLIGHNMMKPFQDHRVLAVKEFEQFEHKDYEDVLKRPREGEYKYKFGKWGKGDGEFNDPRSLTVTKTGLLLVCDWNNDRIQVFDLNGKFVGKCGTNGNNVGEFKYPFAAAFLSNNRIVVSDCHNHRFQIFE